MQRKSWILGVSLLVVLLSGCVDLGNAPGDRAFFDDYTTEAYIQIDSLVNVERVYSILRPTSSDPTAQGQFFSVGIPTNGSVDALTVSWQATQSENIRVEVFSLESDGSSCVVPNGGTLSQTNCNQFPLTGFMYRVTFLGYSELDSIRFDWNLIRGVICGNGNIEAPEECDDGNTQSGDGCSGSCAVESGWACEADASICEPIGSPRCGNGLLDAGELCDCGFDRECGTADDHSTATCANRRPYGDTTGRLFCNPTCTRFDLSQCSVT